QASAGQARNPTTDTTSTFDRDLRAGITASRALVIEGTGAQGSKTRTAAHHSAQGENTQDLRRAALAMQLVRSSLVGRVTLATASSCRASARRRLAAHPTR